MPQNLTEVGIDMDVDVELGDVLWARAGRREHREEVRKTWQTRPIPGQPITVSKL
jgi:hypothetical protein